MAEEEPFYSAYGKISSRFGADDGDELAEEVRALHHAASWRRGGLTRVRKSHAVRGRSSRRLTLGQMAPPPRPRVPSARRPRRIG